MRALDRKLWRDLRLMWSQALTIALVVASGIGGFLTSLSAVDSLAEARDAFYVAGRFADVFVTVKRAPLSLVERLRAVPGVADVQPTIEHVVRITVPGSGDPVLGQLIGVNRREPPRLNQLTIVAGRPLHGDVDAERGHASAAGGSGGGDGVLDAVVSKGFAQARGLKPGATVRALVNGRERTLRIVGWALSPEYIFAGLFGMPDQRGFGIFWVDHDALAAAWDMDGAFNRAAVRLAPASVRTVEEREVTRRLGELLAPYGGAEPRGREDQVSHAMLDNEIKEQRVLGTVLPAIFLGVAAFLLNVVVSRLVATQREQIAALKALGYTHRRIASHYLMMVGLISGVGLVLGVALGHWLGGGLLALYGESFHFPRFVHRVDPALVVVAGGVTLGTAVAGTLGAILATVRLTPAEAMRPPAPGRYRRTLAERLGLRGLSPALRMVLRQMERRPLRTGLGIAGVAAAVAIVVLGNFFRDAIDVIVDTEFVLKMRSDVSVWLVEPADDAVRLQFARMPGVLAVESSRFVEGTLVSGHRRERLLVRAMPAVPDLYRIVDVDGRVATLPGDGLLLTDRLADKLGLRVGDLATLELPTGRRRSVTLPVDGVVSEMMGLNAYIRRDALNRALGDGDLSSGFVLTLERGREAEFLAATQKVPAVSGAFSKATMLRNMREITARNIRVISGVLTLFACVIAVGVVYNNARIALAERAWELASLRVLGFTRGEVTALLLGEMALQIAVALPLGMVLGWLLVHGTTLALRNDQFQFPVEIQPRTYAMAALAIVGAALASAAVVRRRIHRIDMVSALKTRD